MEKISCYVEGSLIDAARLKEIVEKMKSMELFFREMEANGISQTIMFKLFQNDIYTREDFEAPDKLNTIKEELESAGHSVELIKDREHNLFSIQISDDTKKNKRSPLITNFVARVIINNISKYTER